MSETLYTLKEVVGILCRAKGDGDEAKIMRQVRHWTASDLIPTVGKKYTGTGISREYSAHEVRLAAILVELSQYRVPVTILENFGETAERYSGFPEWRDAISGKTPAFLQLAFSEHMVHWQCFGLNSKHNFLVGDPKAKGWPSPASAIVINLTKVFRGLPK